MTGRPEQLDLEAVRHLNADQIDEALRSGALDTLVGTPVPTPRGPGLHPDDVQQALDAGTLDDLLAGQRGADADQGARGNRAPSTAAAIRAELATLTPDEIHARLNSGALDALLRGEVA